MVGYQGCSDRHLLCSCSLSPRRRAGTAAREVLLDVTDMSDPECQENAVSSFDTFKTAIWCRALRENSAYCARRVLQLRAKLQYYRKFIS